MTAREMLTGDAQPVNAGTAWVHRECLLRAVMGSVTHIRRECEYYGGTKDCHACEQGMTKREAARAALIAWRLLQFRPELN